MALPCIAIVGASAAHNAVFATQLHKRLFATTSVSAAVREQKSREQDDDREDSFSRREENGRRQSVASVETPEDSGALRSRCSTGRIRTKYYLADVHTVSAVVSPPCAHVTQGHSTTTPVGPTREETLTSDLTTARPDWDLVGASVAASANARSVINDDGDDVESEIRRQSPSPCPPTSASPPSQSLVHGLKCEGLILLTNDDDRVAFTALSTLSWVSSPGLPSADDDAVRIVAHLSSPTASLSEDDAHNHYREVSEWSVNNGFHFVAVPLLKNDDIALGHEKKSDSEHDKFNNDDGDGDDCDGGRVDVYGSRGLLDERHGALMGDGDYDAEWDAWGQIIDALHCHTWSSMVIRSPDRKVKGTEETPRPPPGYGMLRPEDGESGSTPLTTSTGCGFGHEDGLGQKASPSPFMSYYTPPLFTETELTTPTTTTPVVTPPSPAKAAASIDGNGSLAGVGERLGPFAGCPTAEVADTMFDRLFEDMCQFKTSNKNEMKDDERRRRAARLAQRMEQLLGDEEEDVLI